LAYWAIIQAFWVLSTGLIEGAASCNSPVVAWARSGATWGQFAQRVVSDPLGGVYVVGGFYGALDFDPTNGVDMHASHGDQDLYVTKLDSSGSYVWTRTVGTTENESGNGVAVDDDGNVFVVGGFNSQIDFDPTKGVDERIPIDDPATADKDYNSFVSLLRSDGTYGWTITFGGGNGESFAYAVARDAGGALLIGGLFHGEVDFDPGSGVDLRASNSGSFDGYVTKLAENGNYVWTKTIGGTGFDRLTDVKVDSNRAVYLTGTFRGTVDFDPGPGVDLHTRQGDVEDVFVTKLYADGSYGWTRTWPLRYPGGIGRIAVDADGDVIFSSGFSGAVDFDPSPGTDLRTSTASQASGFVTKINADGSYGWTRIFDSSYASGGTDVAVDRDRNIVVAGYFIGTTDFDPGPREDLRTSTLLNAQNGFVTMLTASGDYLWTFTFDDEDAVGRAIATAFDSEGAVLVAGTYATDYGGALDFDPGCAVNESERDADGDFILRLVCVTPRPDVDGDGDADLHDLAQFQNCFSGGAPYGNGCQTFDFDSDGDVDLTDYSQVQMLICGSIHRR